MAPTEKQLDAAATDFRVFLWLVWKHLGLPEPTPAQYDMAHYLQHGPRRKCLMGFRGVGKSWITSAFVLWLLWRNIEVKVLVVSASKDRSDSFSIFTKRLLGEILWLSHLAPDPKRGDRDSNVAFDVRGCKAHHSPSVKSVGITGQITGSRADYIVCDDVEVPNNAETATQREKLLVRVAELGGAVLTPAAQNNELGGVTFLGTYQVEDSLYNALEERDYTLRIWPAQIPADPDKYHGRLAPMVEDLLAEGARTDTPVDPSRFDTPELAERLVEYGSAGYALQFMLDTTPTDEAKHPLRCSDLVVMDIDEKVGADYIVWAGDTEHCVDHLPRVGLHGDRFQGPMSVSKGFTPFRSSVMYIDPSGRGKDQTGYAVVKFLNGYLFLVDWGAIDGGYDPLTLAKLAGIALRHEVNEVVIEDNFGDGMYTQLFSPVLRKVYKKEIEGEVHAGCAISEEKVTGQKELRIIGTVEPVMASHRLIIDTKLVTKITSSKARSLDIDAALKSGFYQLTRLTKDRGSLKYDDWMDALSGAIRYHTDGLGLDTKAEEGKRLAERLKEELTKFEEGILGQRPNEDGWHDNL